MVTEIRARDGIAHAYAVDLTDAAAVGRVCSRIEQHHGVSDVIVNKAGAGRWLWPEETEPDEAAEMIAAPYLAAFNVTRAFLPGMLARRTGCIVNVTSLAAFLPWPGATAYAAARWAMRGFTESLRADLAGTGIRVTLVCFASVSSAYWRHNPGIEERIPGAQRLIRVLTPEEAGGAIVRGIYRGRRRVAAPWSLQLWLALSHWFPPISRWVVRRTGYRRQAGPRPEVRIRAVF